MKIGIVLSRTPGYSETFFISKIKGLLTSGHEVVLLVQKRESNFNLCTVKVAPKITKNPLLMFFTSTLIFIKCIGKLNTVRRYYKLLKAEGYSKQKVFKSIYVNAHILTEKLDWLHFGFTTQAVGKEFVAKAIKAKMAISFRGFDIEHYPLEHPNSYQKVWQQVDKVHTISNYLLEKAYTLGLPKNVSFQKITPAIDATFFQLKKTPDFSFSNTIQFLTIGRYSWKKGFEDTLVALRILKDKGFSFHYTLIGSGSKVEIERIQFIAQLLDLENDVTLTGKLTKEEIKKHAERAQVYIQYSISEGFCNATLEAQSMGLLCVVSDAGGLPENVIHDTTGWVVPMLSPHLLASQIEHVLSLPKQHLQEITVTAKERVKTQFSVLKQQEEFVAFYES